MSTKPFLSIVLPSFNSKNYYSACLNSLLKINYPNFEIIVVDDGSTDGSLEAIKKISQKNPRLKVVETLKRKGIPSSRNVGVEVSQGELIAFLDMDMEITETWPNGLIRVLLDKKEVVAVLPKVLDFHQRNIIQTVGGRIIPYSAWVFVRGYGEIDKGQYSEEEEISINAAGAIVKREAVYLLGGFDESLGAFDDLDFGWRLWVAGFRSLVVPQSIIYHWTVKAAGTRHAGSSKMESEYHLANVVRMMIKNLEIGNLVKYLPLAILINLLRVLVNLLRGNVNPFLGLIKAYVTILINLPKILEQRYEVQILRKFGDKRLFGSAFVSGNIFKTYRDVFLKNIEISRSWHLKGAIKAD